MLFSTLIAFSSLALAAPPPPAPAAPAPFMDLCVSRFQAFTSPSDTNWTSFFVADATESNIFMCTYQCTEALDNPNTWHKCKPRKGSGVDMAFQFGKGMTRVGLRKSWEGASGMYLIGYADQQTNWCDEKGGNVTAVGGERYYERMGEWGFTMDRLVG